MAKTVQLGTLYYKDEPVKKGESGMALSDFRIGDTSESRPLKWIKSGNLLICNKVLFLGYSWNDFDIQGYVKGWPIRIDGVCYTCRMPTSEEWKTAVTRESTSDEIWHWKEAYSLMQECEEAITGTDYCIAYGGSSALDKYYVTPFEGYPKVGLRPVLEWLPDSIPITQDALGKYIEVYSNDGRTDGFLQGFSDYDLFLTSEEGPVQPSEEYNGVGGWLAIATNGDVVIDRNQITWIREAESFTKQDAPVNKLKYC